MSINNNILSKVVQCCKRCVLFMMIVLLCFILTFLAIHINFMIINKTTAALKFTENEGRGILAGKMKQGPSCALLPNPKGNYKYCIIIYSGELQLSHHIKNPDGSKWSYVSGKGEGDIFCLEGEGIYTYLFNIGESGRTENIELMNTNLWNDTEFYYKIDLKAHI